MKRFSLSIMALAFAAGLASAADFRDAETLGSLRLPDFSFVSYVGVSGGSVYASGEFLPSMESAAGIQFTPWFAVGGFVGGTALSDFDHGSFGADIADRDNAFCAPSGTELIFTPFSARKIHPLIRIALGGATVGYSDHREEGDLEIDSSETSRFFFAAASVGAEANLTRHLRLTAAVGGRFVDNDDLMGIDEAGLSGLEASIGLRFFWRTLVD